MGVFGDLMDFAVSLEDPGDFLKENSLGENGSTSPFQVGRYEDLTVRFEDGHDVLNDVENAEVVGDPPLSHWVGKSIESGCHLRLPKGGNKHSVLSLSDPLLQR